MYRLGLLQCDVVAPELQAKFQDYPVMFAKAFEQAGIAVIWQVYNLLEGEQPKSLDEVDGYITTGARAGVYDELHWYANLVALIRDIHSAQIPLVGICFGHQAIADALGGAVENSGKGWGIGINNYQVTAQGLSSDVPAWMTPLLDEFVVPVCHQDQVVKLPAGSTVLAHSAHCENFVAQFSATSLGIQGHPEFEAAYVSELIKLREEILPAEVALEAKNSLNNTHDNQTIIRWIAQFLKIRSA
jgi:GMP synthase-like glutamine amidotransferase